MKHYSHKLSALTAYDYTLAKIFDTCGIDIILVGDSLGNVIKGEQNTLGVTVEEICYHTQCVRRGVTNALLMVDMPYQSDTTPKEALSTAKKLIDAGAEILKIEGAKFAVIEALLAQNIRICSHLGLEPQSIETMGLKVQGRDAESAETIMRNAEKLEQLGVEMMLLECVPCLLAQRITELLNIPTIGIGAGSATSGQILVGYDMLGISGHLPKFVKNFGQDADIISATKTYINEVRDGVFPSSEYSYH